MADVTPATDEQVAKIATCARAGPKVFMEAVYPELALAMAARIDAEVAARKAAEAERDEARAAAGMWLRERHAVVKQRDQARSEIGVFQRERDEARIDADCAADRLRKLAEEGSDGD